MSKLRPLPHSETCAYCPAAADQDDHIIPRSRGGADEPCNIVRACCGCNCSKWVRLPSEWRSDLPKIIYDQEKKLKIRYGIKRSKRRPFDGSAVAIRVKLTVDERYALHETAKFYRLSTTEYVRYVLLKNGDLK